MDPLAESRLGLDFLSHVRDALAHLFDTAHLQNHPLTAHLVPSTITDPKARAQALTEALLQAITDLKPPPGVSPRDPAYRPYAVLRYKYAEGASNEHIQDRLAISRRQFFREQQRACEALAALLWERRLDRDEETDLGQTLTEELEQLGLQPRPFAVATVLEQAIAAVRSLTDSCGVALSLRGPIPAQAFADQALTRQLMVSLLSGLSQAAPGTYLELEVRDEERWVTVSVGGLPASLSAEALEAHLRLPGQLARRVGGRLEVTGEGYRPALRLLLPSAREDHVVIVDDNPKTLRLFQRYLEPHRYRVTAIQESVQALDEIRRLRPDVVLLDVMMRDVDGWQILQTLKTDPDTRHIPVIVCSVLEEETLAHTIGADAYLRKPISQSSLVLALAQARRG
ncbi:MAG: response regulator [Anaerolineae bacterium]|nr:response regulator [Anaerolineae bacterium]